MSRLDALVGELLKHTSRSYRVPPSNIKYNILQFVLSHNVNLIDDYVSMDLIIDEDDTVDWAEFQTLPVNMTVAIDKEVEKM